jgi:hypothetical protein
MSEKILHNAIQDINETIVADREGVGADELKDALKIAPTPADLMGNWINVNSATRSIVKIQIGWSGGLKVHLWGACSPTPCDWKVVSGLAYGANVSSSRAIAFTAAYHFSFKDTIVSGFLQNGYLTVYTLNHFTDGSNRYDYVSTDVFKRG